MGAITHVSVLVSRLRARGVELSFVNGKLLVEAPTGTVTIEELAALREHKNEVTALLADTAPESKCPGSALCKGCYEVTLGIHLHPPKATSDWQEWFRRWQPEKVVLQ